MLIQYNKVQKVVASLIYTMKKSLSEETAQPTVNNHLTHLSVDIQLSGLFKFREDNWM